MIDPQTTLLTCTVPCSRLPQLSTKPLVTFLASEHTTLWPVPNYTALWQVTVKPATRRLPVTSQTMPPSHCHKNNETTTCRSWLVKIEIVIRAKLEDWFLSCLACRDWRSIRLRITHINVIIIIIIIVIILRSWLSSSTYNPKHSSYQERNLLLKWLRR